MQNKIRRAATVAVATGGALAVFTGTAAAHYCTNESLQGRAGEAWALFSTEFEPIMLGGGLRLKGDRVVGGGFADFYIDVNESGELDEGDMQLAENMFIHAGLPVSALTAAGCDKGVGTAFPEEFGMEACP